jgi:2-hydroxy-3-keto-5-methylthiopentenyl-1-phosphate phosphatase
VQLVLDWDGTVTERDTLDLVLSEFGDAEIYERAEAELDAGRMTLNDVISTEFATVTARSTRSSHTWSSTRACDPGFAELARARHPLVVSSGFHELIEPVLEREGVVGAVELRANRVEARPDGWRVRFRVAETCEVCGEPCKRGDLPNGEVAYAGDGHSDYCAALAADRIYATGSLAGFLDRRGVPYEPLTDFRAFA